MKFELTDEQYKRLWGDKQDAADLLEYAHKEMEKALNEFTRETDMITIEEIKEHLATTVYSSGARKTILGYLIGRGIDTDDIEFAKRNCGAREQGSKTFEDFMTFVREKEFENRSEEYLKGLSKIYEESAEEFAEAWARCIDNINHQSENNEDFQIGDWVKYVPNPDEESTECIEAIAHGTDGEMYLCLSNGEYVRPCYCVKYKAQGEERRKLIDKLNEVV